MSNTGQGPNMDVDWKINRNSELADLPCFQKQVGRGHCGFGDSVG